MKAQINLLNGCQFLGLPWRLANNAGCFLAVCTTAGRVKLFRFPFCEFSAEWVELEELEELGTTKDDDRVNVSSERELLERWPLESLCIAADGAVGFTKLEKCEDRTKFLAAEVGKVEKRRIEDLLGYDMVERCKFCSAVVPFESTENAICSGVNYDNGVIQRHKLKRCSITMSMSVLPTKPSWHWSCCHRQTIKLALTFYSECSSILQIPNHC
ncbi:hypothetical protein CASFOL_023732 [Castilleja foliolosa]|uniref:Uncharacterized protein n=1 Tax=Castilleja foliolosa TaxID=1961234 RepID=A0ABD3CLB9_9LAMI